MLSCGREGLLEWGDERRNVISLSSVKKLYGKRIMRTDGKNPAVFFCREEICSIEAAFRVHDSAFRLGC